MKFINQKGSATIGIAGLLLVIFSLFSFGIAGLGILITKHKLDSAIDLAALSAAYQLPQLNNACELARSKLTQAGFGLANCQGELDWIQLEGEAKMAMFSYPIVLRAQATAGW